MKQSEHTETPETPRQARLKQKFLDGLAAKNGQAWVDQNRERLDGEWELLKSGHFL